VAPVPSVNERLRLPSSRRSRIYREIARRLMADPTLARTVKTWRVWDGRSESDDPITTSQCPFVRLTPYGGGAENRDNISQRGTLRVEVEMATAGLNIEDVFDLWDAMEDVLFPSSQAAGSQLRDALNALGGERKDIKVSDPASIATDISGGLIRAVGSFTYVYRIQG
jgi:hypothetical protein